MFLFGSCFPDMVRKKRTENEWFKLEKVYYKTEPKRIEIFLKGTVKNPSLASLEAFELNENSSDTLLFQHEKPLTVGSVLLRFNVEVPENKDWIRKVGTTRKWIAIVLKNDNGQITHLQTEISIHESDKKQFRKDLSLEAEGEFIRLDGREWKLVSDVDRMDQALLQYIPKQESLLFWSEMLSIHIYKVRVSSPTEIYSLLESGKKKECPNILWSLESEKSGKISYSWEHSGCGKQPTSSQVSKLYRGEFGIYNIRYDKRGKIGPEDKTHWSELLDRLPSKLD
ncbi:MULTISPECIES: hypothetical protein [unclassified Leptospira]|uniref:hypothetical protein n=1 Tax=unclassified Leptospira TaxID=2633828 RepID=UPI0002BEC654|nr:MULTISPECIES: hypothetical protein [unclassified Leptospira]EMJ99712.1 hypothetical protein LEP1GSC192_1070 [Leptospira sp. B5-022]